MEEHRTAFTIRPLLDRRQAGGGGAPIRALTVDASGSKLYLGLEDGVLEEHALAADTAAASLTARKHVSKRSIVSVLHLGAVANSLAVLTDDGALQLLDCESLSAQLLPLRHVVAACVAPALDRPSPLLAVVLRPSKRMVQIEVYEVPPAVAGGAGWGRRPPLAHAEVPDGSAVKGLAWLGPCLVLCTGLKYVLVAPGQAGGQWRELFAIPEDLAYSPAMIQPIPHRGQAMLTVGPAGIVIDASGSPVGSALRLDGLATPRALAASGAFVLAACEDGVHVFDCGRGGGGAEVQQLGYGRNLRPLPGQPMYAAGNPSGSVVVVAGRAIVWACLPVSLEEQAREALRRREYEKAGELIERGLRQGEGWVEAASAQAALCMLHDCEFEGAAEALERCSPEVFHPAELFPLFPAHTQPWASQVPGKRYWGLCPPLEDLDALIARRLQSAASSPRSSVSSARAGGGGDAGWTNGAQQQGQREGSPPRSITDQQQHRKAQHEQAGGSSSGEGQHGGEAERLQRQARQCLVQYLFRVRMMGGVACLEGVDTLLLQLLADLGAVRQVAAFASVPNQADGKAVAARLQALGWHHALATLWAARGDTEAALHIWRQLVQGGLPPPQQQQQGAAAQDPELHVAERQEALDSAAALLRDPRTSSEGTVLSSLPWLLPASPAAALSVLTARPLDPPLVLAALPSESDVRWQYLDHLVACMSGGASSIAAGIAGAAGQGGASRASSRASMGSSRLGGGSPQPPPAPAQEGIAAALRALGPSMRARVHTELATQLVAAILRQDPGLRTPEPPGRRAPPPRSLGPLARASSLGSTSGLRRGASGSSASVAAGRGEGRAGGGGPAGGGRGGLTCSTAALVSRGSSIEEAPEPAAAAVLRLRLRLRQHLEESGEYDRAAVLGAMGGSGLHEELVVLHAQMGDHLSVLRLLALVLRDIAAALAYATAQLPPAEYRTLLQLVLHPGPGVEPLYDDATYLVTALGDHLDPLDVVASLPPAMPLGAAAAIVSPILRDRMHRRRQGAVAKNLLRAALTAARGAQCDAEAGRVVVDDERACPGCHLRIGGKVFVVLQHLPEEGSSGAAAEAGPGGGPGAAAAVAAALKKGQGKRQQEGERVVVCYNCYRRMAAAAGQGAGAQSVGAASP